MESHAKSKASASQPDLNFSDDDDLVGEFPVSEDDRWRRPSSGAKRGAAASPPSCQADMCAAVLADAKRYHRRHKVCEFHAKAPVVVVAGLRQRFCQQCSKFHEVSEFDEVKRSCRRRLAGHNERRRKGSTSSEVHTSGGGDQIKGKLCRVQEAFPDQISEF
ncbi:hypothetical protein V2J09_023713 [Rumex salicifolius]